MITSRNQWFEVFEDVEAKRLLRCYKLKQVQVVSSRSQGHINRLYHCMGMLAIIGKTEEQNILKKVSKTFD